MADGDLDALLAIRDLKNRKEISDTKDLLNSNESNLESLSLIYTEKHPKIIQAKKLMHGKTSFIKSKKIGILKNLPSKFEATRYHSLIVDKKTLSDHLEITAETEDGIIMGIMHKEYNIHGVQFHPESIKTTIGIKILKNFINYKSK